MSGPVRRQSAPAATPREYPTASACHPWAWLPPFRFVASAPPTGSPSLDLPQTLPRLRGRTPPPQPHVQPVHASHANRASASWFSRIVISTRLAHPQAFENPLRTPSDSIRPDYALSAATLQRGPRGRGSSLPFESVTAGPIADKRFTAGFGAADPDGSDPTLVDVRFILGKPIEK